VIVAGETRLLVLDETFRRDEGRLGAGIDRRRALSALKAAGITVQHDSGGRLLVIEADDEAAAAVTRQLRGARILPLREGGDDRMVDLEALDAQDALFARALDIRLSPEYRERKRRQVPGETPEEQLLISGPCTPPEG
jgi:hypothetical protein